MPPESFPPDSFEVRQQEDLERLTPERAEEVASIIAEGWKRDWGAVLELVIAKTGLSRSDAFQFMVLMELAKVRTALENGIQPKYHPDCIACQNEKRFHELQQEALELTVRHLKEEHGDEWKDG